MLFEAEKIRRGDTDIGSYLSYFCCSNVKVSCFSTVHSNKKVLKKR